MVKVMGESDHRASWTLQKLWLYSVRWGPIAGHYTMSGASFKSATGPVQCWEWSVWGQEWKQRDQLEAAVESWQDSMAAQNGYSRRRGGPGSRYIFRRWNQKDSLMVWMWVMKESISVILRLLAWAPEGWTLPSTESGQTVNLGGELRGKVWKW